MHAMETFRTVEPRIVMRRDFNNRLSTGNNGVAYSGSCSTSHEHLMSTNFMFGKLDTFLQIAVAACFAVLVALLARPAPMMALGLGILGIAMVSLGYLARRRLKMATNTDGRSARALVTQLMAELTRVQVAYLARDFSSAKDGMIWLEKALPRSFRDSAESLHESLEQARNGQTPHELRLVLRIREKQAQLAPIDEGLSAYAKKHPEYTANRPAVFVVTENIGREGGPEDPEIYSVAGWHPGAPALLPEVDLLTVFDPQKESSVLGQIALDEATSHLSQ
jgi:hypothetical protein